MSPLDATSGLLPRTRVPSFTVDVSRFIADFKQSREMMRAVGSMGVAARELLLNTSAVANLIAEGKTSQLPMAIDSGRKHGMVPLNDALASFVQNGIVDSREAYRQASDQQGFLGLLKRQGIDTSFVERLA